MTAIAPATAQSAAQSPATAKIAPFGDVQSAGHFAFATLLDGLSRSQPQAKACGEGRAQAQDPGETRREAASQAQSDASATSIENALASLLAPHINATESGAAQDAAGAESQSAPAVNPLAVEARVLAGSPDVAPPTGGVTGARVVGERTFHLTSSGAPSAIPANGSGRMSWTSSFSESPADGHGTAPAFGLQATNGPPAAGAEQTPRASPSFDSRATVSSPTLRGAFGVSPPVASSLGDLAGGLASLTPIVPEAGKLEAPHPVSEAAPAGTLRGTGKQAAALGERGEADAGAILPPSTKASPVVARSGVPHGSTSGAHGTGPGQPQAETTRGPSLGAPPKSSGSAGGAWLTAGEPADPSASASDPLWTTALSIWPGGAPAITQPNSDAQAAPAAGPVLPASATASASASKASLVREIDLDLSPGGLEDVSMTMRLAGERLSVVIRAPSSQTIGAIEGAREAIAERLAAIGQPLGSLVIQQTGSTNGTTSAKDWGGDSGGAERQNPGDPRGSRRGSPGD